MEKPQIFLKQMNFSKNIIIEIITNVTIMQLLLPNWLMIMQ